MMPLRLAAIMTVLAGSLSACLASPAPVGSVTIGTSTFEVFSEENAATAGHTTNFVIEPKHGGNPTSIHCWVGPRDLPDDKKVLAVYDPPNAQFDAIIVIPAELPTGSEFFLDVETAGVVETGGVKMRGVD